jgi:hypothetical protein
MHKQAALWRRMALVLGATLTIATAGLAADYHVAVGDTMQRIRIDAPYQGLAEKAGALTQRPNPASVAQAVKYTPSLRVSSEDGRMAALSAAGGEAEGFQLVITAAAKDLQTVKLTASPLTGKARSRTIPADRVTFQQVGYVKTQRPGYGVERVGWFADPLLPVTSFDVKQGEVQPVWVTIHVPPDTPRGVYTGSVTVKPANAAPTTVAISLRVWGFNIPTTGSLGLAFSWFDDTSRSIHGKAAWEADGLKRRYMDMLLDYRIGPDNIYRGSPPPAAEAAYAVKRGAPSFNLFNVGWPTQFTDAQIQSILKRIGNVWPAYQKAGITRQAYIFGFDETYRETAIKQIYGAIGEQYPDLRRMVCTGLNGAVADYVDIWAMGVGTYWHHTTKQAELVSKLRKRGVQFWLYLSTAAMPPVPNWFIESPLIESRSVMWHLQRVDADGFLYYAINHVTGPQTPIDEAGGPYTQWNPRSFMNFNGDGHLIYAGRGGPLASIRLANIRDGLEDYEYMKLLEKRLVSKGKFATESDAHEYVKREFTDRMVRNFWIHSHDPGVLRTLRHRMAEAIESL